MPPPSVKRRSCVRGVSADLGSATDVSERSSTGGSIAEAVARSLRGPGEYRAVLDPATLVLLHWDGDAPERIQWQRTGLDEDGAFVHPDDVEAVRSAAPAVDEGPHGGVSSVRLRTRDGVYEEVLATVHNVGSGRRCERDSVGLSRPRCRVCLLMVTCGALAVAGSGDSC